MSRDNWSSRTGFILAAAGSAVGLGNIWKFPYLAGTYGGGVFLAVYLILVFTIVKSVMLSEIAIGRAAQKNPVGAFAKLHNNKWKIVGFFGVIAAFMILSFYSVVAGWTIHYTLKTVTGSLNNLGAKELGDVFGGFITGYGWPVFYHALFMIATVFVVSKGVSNGIEKLSRILMPLLFVFVIILIIRSLSLEGASEGLKFYLLPDWSKFNFEMFSAALGQAFFSLSLGMGTMLTYGSYLSKKERLPSTSLYVSFLDSGIAFLAGLLILPAVFALGFDNSAGPGLTFITLPAIFNQIWGGQVFGTIFFMLLGFAALTSSVSILEVVTSYLHEEKNMSRKKSATIVGLATFVVGIAASYSLGPWSGVTLNSVFGTEASLKIMSLGIFDLLDYISSNLLLPLGGIFISIFVGWMQPKSMMKEITNDGTIDFWWKGIFLFTTKFLTPIAITFVLLKSLGIL